MEKLILKQGNHSMQFDCLEISNMSGAGDRIQVYLIIFENKEDAVKLAFSSFSHPIFGCTIFPKPSNISEHYAVEMVLAEHTEINIIE